MAAYETSTNVKKDAPEGFDEMDRILNDITLVWLDENSDDHQDSLLDLSTRVNQIVHNVRKVRRIDDCLDYLRSNSDKPTFLLVSSPLNEDVLEDILRFSHIAYVYIFKNQVFSL